MLWFNFIPGLNFILPLFLGMVIYDNEFETKENKIWTKAKIEDLNHNIYIILSWPLELSLCCQIVAIYTVHSLPL